MQTTLLGVRDGRGIGYIANLEDFSSQSVPEQLYSYQSFSPLKLLAAALKPFNRYLGSLLPQRGPYGFDFGREQVTT